MFPSWRLKIRAARLAVEDGRWDDATSVLSRDSVRGFLPAKRLAQEVAGHLVQRAERRIAQGDTAAGWRDLQQAGHLGECDEQIDLLRKHQSQMGLERVRSLLRKGETTLAEQQLAKMEQRRLGGPERPKWQRIVNLISRAQVLSGRGEFAGAGDALDQAGKLLPDGDSLAGELSDRQQRLRESGKSASGLNHALHEALGEERWQAVLTTADSLLELAPDHPAALEARRRAWKAVGIDSPVIAAPRNGRNQRRPLDPLPRQGSTIAWHTSATRESTMSSDSPGDRMVAWIDAVGAYLFCLDSEVFIGQAAPGNPVDLPFRADLSRRHASIRREGDQYVIIPIHPVKLDQQSITGPAVLRDQSLIQLGDSLQIRFLRPHSLSATAVLRIESPHKTEPAVDGILLMSESCVVGPNSHSHIRCRDWLDDLVLFRRGDNLHFRSRVPVEVEGQPAGTSGTVLADSRLVRDDFALVFERL